MSDKHECCNVISKSVKDIIRWSFNDSFRQKCFELLEVNNSFEAENKVRKLLTEIGNSSCINPKPRKRIKRIRDDKDVQTPIPQKVVAPPAEIVASAQSLVPKEKYSQWDLGDIKAADIDDWK